MERDIVAIVAKQLKDAQDNHAAALHNVQEVEAELDELSRQLEEADERLINIEEIHNVITPD